MLETLKAQKIQARKERNKLTLKALDFVFSKLDKKRVALKLKSIDELSTEDIIKAIESEVKEQKQTYEFTKGTEEGKEVDRIIKYLEGLLPKKLTEKEVRSILTSDGLLGVERSEIGLAMKKAKEILQGEQVDMGMVSKLVREG